MSRTEVSIIIVNYNGCHVIVDCLHSIFAYIESPNIEVIVVDNASQDGSPELIADKFPQVKLLRQTQNWGFGTANNIGVRHAAGDSLFLLNSDTVLTDNILPALIAKLESAPDIGMVGPRLINQDGSFQLSIAHEIGLWGEFKTLQQVRQYRNPRNRPALAQQYGSDRYVDIIVGAAMLMRRSLFETVGGFDEAFFMYFEESDLCQRVRELGYQLLYTPEVSLVHLGGYSVAQAATKMAETYRHSQRYYYQKHRPLWEQWVLERYLALKRWRQRKRTTKAKIG
ncbi:glycosyltransferase family 2 protein [Oscillatoria sp. CS-180]|uniref:glycosyltransferase family 2 protein n=1 Tax=Oscillatoria sp. CS-180 TaxID=3021720 RepID=UPI0023314841|nr:glycosyltransferase family 2 protein [Oscillatoria sp. CS-180]MDB9525373.1 glycosyltransferase family 2 protein [Oscillatoria sp. CS-180]